MADKTKVTRQLWALYEATLATKWNSGVKSSVKTAPKLASFDLNLTARVVDWPNWRDATFNCVESAAETASLLTPSGGTITDDTFLTAAAIVEQLWSLGLLDRKGAPPLPPPPGALCA